MAIADAIASPDAAIDMIFEKYRNRSSQLAALKQASERAKTIASETFDKMNQCLVHYQHGPVL